MDAELKENSHVLGIRVYLCLSVAKKFFQQPAQGQAGYRHEVSQERRNSSQSPLCSLYGNRGAHVVRTQRAVLPELRDAAVERRARRRHGSGWTYAPAAT